MTAAVQLAQSVAPGVSLGFKNRIINGAMTIDQRNAGASVNILNDDYFAVDRFSGRNTASSASFTLQQVSDGPAGFTKALKLTVTATESFSSGTAYCRIHQGVEANNISDLGWGASGAQTVTVSFWVKSSVTGTFSMSINNSALSYSYPVSYTISSANTWEQKTFTIPGPTAGTWATGVNVGLYIEWTLGATSNLLGPSGSWAAARYEGVTGQVNLFATNGATFYITGVQLEVGTTATSFEFRDYGRELIMCQRYYYRVKHDGSTYSSNRYAEGHVDNSTTYGCIVPYPVTMRTFATCNYSAAGDWSCVVSGNVYVATGMSINSTPYGCQPNLTISGATAGQAGALRAQTTSAWLDASAEL